MRYRVLERHKKLMQSSLKWSVVFQQEQFALSHKFIGFTWWPLLPSTLHDLNIFEDMNMIQKCCSHSFQGEFGPLSVIKWQGGKVIRLQLVSRRAGETTQNFDPYSCILTTWLNFLPDKMLAYTKLFCLIVQTALSACVYMISVRHYCWSVPVSLINEFFL